MVFLGLRNWGGCPAQPHTGHRRGCPTAPACLASVGSLALGRPTTLSQTFGHQSGAMTMDSWYGGGGMLWLDADVEQHESSLRIDRWRIFCHLPSHLVLVFRH